jgi:hypothetical protein
MAAVKLQPGDPVRWYQAEGKRHLLHDAIVLREISLKSVLIELSSGRKHVVRRENLMTVLKPI